VIIVVTLTPVNDQTESVKVEDLKVWTCAEGTTIAPITTVPTGSGPPEVKTTTPVVVKETTPVVPIETTPAPIVSG